MNVEEKCIKCEYDFVACALNGFCYTDLDDEGALWQFPDNIIEITEEDLKEAMWEVDVAVNYHPTSICYNDYMDLVNDLWHVYERKNKDYGNSFRKSLEEFGRIAFVVRVSDKMERLKQLAELPEGEVKDESFADTVEDMALYCLMYLLEDVDYEM